MQPSPILAATRERATSYPLRRRRWKNAALGAAALAALGASAFACGDDPEEKEPAPKVTMLSSGVCQSCYVHDGALTCWGNAAWDKMPTGMPAPVSLPAEAIDVAVGPDHVCANVWQKGVYCWGVNDAGQLGVAIPDPDPSEPITEPTKSKMSPLVTKLAAGSGFTCGIVNGAVQCMGGNIDGTLGNGDYTRSVDPIDVPGLITVVDVAAGRAHACAIDKDGDTYCWGQNDLGQAGQDKDQTDVVANAAQVMIPKADRLMLGSETSCAHTTDGDVWCWGSNQAGQFGDMEADTGLPRKTTLATYKEVALGKSRVFGLKQEGTVDYWGLEISASPSGYLPPGQEGIHGVNNVSEISAGPNHGCGISGANVFCWGDNSCNQLGGVAGNISSVPVKIL
jgi:alpha-tubulin suppressor-like RCC1 family protein